MLTEVAVMVGAREALPESGFLQGGTLGVRVNSGWWEVGLGQYVRMRGDAASPLTALLLERAEAANPELAFVQPEDVSSAATTLWVSWGPRGEGGFWGAPRVVLGVEGQVVSRRVYGQAGAQTEMVDVTNRLGVGPVAGIAFDARLASPLGLRLSVLDRTWIGPAIDYSANHGVGDQRQWFHVPTLSLDLSWSL